jgi:hypothetical protein
MFDSFVKIWQTIVMNQKTVVLNADSDKNGQETASDQAQIPQQYDPEIDFEVICGGNGITITRYRGLRTEVRIPPFIRNLPVTRIKKSAFEGHTELASVTIPVGVTSIEEGAFSACGNLTTPVGVTSIEEGTFSAYRNLTTINVASDNTVYVSENGVLYDKAKTTLIRYPTRKTGSSFNIPDSVNCIGDSAFSGCSSLASVTIPNIRKTARFT